MMNQLIVAPILLPLLTAALMLMLGEKHRPLKAKINLFSSLLGLGFASCCCNGRKGGPAPSACTCRATGRRRSASCWWWTACRR
jgi:hypothetical protein